jgi:hypothetical protein
MTIVTQLVTFASTAVQFPATPVGQLVNRVYAEPLRTNTHAGFVGISTVTNTGTGVGVIKEIAIPTVGILDMFDARDEASHNTIDPTQLYGHGTTGESLKVTYFVR